MGYTHILAPGRIGNMTLRNRIFMSPMGSNLAEEDGFCAERIAKYYETRAEGGAANESRWRDCIDLNCQTDVCIGK